VARSSVNGVFDELTNHSSWSVNARTSRDLGGGEGIKGVHVGRSFW
jgi:hypothetical protein